MSPARRFALAVSVLGLLMTGPFLLTALVIWADAGAAERALLRDLIAPRLPLGALITALGFGAGLLLLQRLFRRYVRGLARMAEALRQMLGANRDFRIDAEGPAEVRELALVANALAAQRDVLLDDVRRRTAEAQGSVEEEGNRLAALMSAAASGILVCHLDGHILRHNPRARLQLKALAQGGDPIAAGQTIFSVLDRGQIDHALQGIRQRMAKGSAEPLAEFLAASPGGQLLRVRMAPVLHAAGADAEFGADLDPNVAPSAGAGGTQGDRHTAASRIAGYVLTLDSLSRRFADDAERDHAMQRLVEDARAALGGVRRAAATLGESAAPLAADAREQLARTLGEDTAALTRRLDAAANALADAQKTRRPLEDVLGRDVLAVAARRIEDQLALPVKREAIDDALWLRADVFSLVFAIAFLAARLQEHYAIRELRLGLRGEADRVQLDLIWSGPPVSAETLHGWELEPMAVGDECSPLTLRDVIDRHDGELRFLREKAAHRLLLRLTFAARKHHSES